MSTSRQTAREGLAALLQAALVGAGLPAQAVYDYQVGDFQGASPVVVVSSAGSERSRASLGACWHTTVYLWVHVFVLYSDGTWTEADAEDKVDAIEAAIADVVLANSSYSGYWDKLIYDEPTLLDGVEIGGVEYRREVIRLRAEVNE